jgi:DNA-directed RNA polymerase specialized sigma subunit
MRAVRHPSVRSIAERDALILANQGLIGCIIRQLWRVPRIREMGWDDAFAEGEIILIRAAELWEEGRVKFSTYAGRALTNQLPRVALKYQAVRRPGWIFKRGREPPPALPLFVPLEMDWLPWREDETDGGPCLADVLAVLSEPAKEVCRLRAKGLTLIEVGLVLDLSATRVEYLARQARGLAREIFEP